MREDARATAKLERTCTQKLLPSNVAPAMGRGWSAP